MMRVSGMGYLENVEEDHGLDLKSLGERDAEYLVIAPRAAGLLGDVG